MDHVNVNVNMNIEEDVITSNVILNVENSLSGDVGRKNKSAVWKWFKKLSKEDTVCNICKQKFKRKSATTTSLKRHIENKHADVYKTLGEGGSCSSRDAESEKNNSEAAVVMLDENSVRARSITQGIARMIILDCQTFSIVADKGFKDLLKILEPRYKMPSRTTFTDNMIPKMFDFEKKKIEGIIKKDMETTRTFAFTTDGWTSRANENYMSVTVHYLDDTFQIKNYTLKINALSESHTSENLNDFLKNTLNEWGLDTHTFKIFFVTDNAANLVKAIRLSDTWERIPCFAHTLQLAIKDAIKHSEELTVILKKCKAIVKFFHHSAAAEEKLKAEQMIHYPDRNPLKLINDIGTRWNSQYDMLNRFLQIRRALNTVLCEPRMPDLINSREWSMIEECCNSLKIFKEATNILTIQNAPTLSRYFPTIYGMKQTLLDMIANDNIQQTLNFKNNLLVELGNRFKFIENCKYLISAMIMDPRVKDRLLSDEKKQEVRDLLRSFATSCIRIDVSETTAVREQVPESSASSGSLFTFFKNLSDYEDNYDPDVVGKEITTYLREKIIPQESCILKWWSENATRFANLAPVAKTFLGIPATQAYSERLFSLAGNIVTDKRTCLLSERVEQICFLSANTRQEYI